MQSKMSYGLIQAVLEKSNAQTWAQAVTEWRIVDCEESEDHCASCVCGKEGIRYMFTIRNVENGNTLFPIGSQCIRRFELKNLSSEVSVYEKLFGILKEFEKNNGVEFSSRFFSKKLIEFLYEEGCFKATVFNGSDPRRDFEFMMDMFNIRSERTEKQKRKLQALIRKDIIPYLRKRFRKEP